MDKSVLDETNTQYIGMYTGQILTPQVTSFVESSDCVINIGTILSDLIQVVIPLILKSKI